MLDYIVSVLTFPTVVVGLLAGIVVYYMTQRYKYKLPPGPFPLPIVGNMMQFKTGQIHQEIYEMSKNYGPVMSIYMGNTHAVVVNDINSAMEVLIKKGSDFATRPHVPSIDLFTEGGRDIVFGQYGPTWKLHRRIAVKALRHYMQGDALEERLHTTINTIFDLMKQEKQPFDPEKYINFIMGNILTGICFGGSYEYMDKELNRILELEDELFEIFDSGGPAEDFIPGLKYFWETKKMKQLKVGVEELLTFFRTKYAEHVKKFDKNNIRDFADTLILARLEAENDPNETDVDKLTDTHIIQTLADIFFAGIDTSRLTLRYAILHMAVYPEIQSKVQDEIDSVVGLDELPKVRHRPQLSYTEAVLHESMRLSSVLPTGVLHQTTRDTSVGGFDVPKGSMAIINHWALHHDPKAWENVDDFIPERFLDKDGKLGPKPESWLPFSAGRRVCLGETVAKPELHLLFAALMQKFTWRIQEGTKVDLSPTGNMFVSYPRTHAFVVKERKP